MQMWEHGLAYEQSALFYTLVSDKFDESSRASKQRFVEILKKLKK